jgi:hypothetical protein
LRFINVILATFLIFVISLSSVFFTRSSVVTSLVNDYLAQYKSTLSCIDFTINADFDLVITKLCIDSPYAEVEFTGVLVEWHFEPSYLTLDNVVEAISQITINSANISAKAGISFTSSVNKSPKPLGELPNTIRQLMHDIANYIVPLVINIEHFNYQPFVGANGNIRNLDNDVVIPGYQGKLSTNNHKSFLSLVDGEKNQVLSLDLARTGADFTANISTDLARLLRLIKQHESALSPVISAHLGRQLVEKLDKVVGDTVDEKTSISGGFTSQINWHNQALAMSNTLSNFSFHVEQGITPLGSVKVAAMLSWQAYLAGDNLQIDFSKNNIIEVALEEKKLTEFLSSQVNDKKIKDVIEDNPISALSIVPLGSIKVDFNKQSTIIDGITFLSDNLTKPLTLSLSEIVLNCTNKSLRNINFQQGRFNLKGLVNIAQLQPYNKQPLMLDFVGDITREMNTWQLEISPETSIEIYQLSLQDSKIESLISHWQGQVFFIKNTLENNTERQKKSTTDVTFNLHINNQISQLNLPEVIQVKSLELNAMLSGSIDNIVISSKVIVDELPVATVKITGDIRHPSVVASAKDIFITDILALKVKLPISLKLIDGTFSYQLSGQLENYQNLMANPMLLVLSVKDVTGQIDGTWLQELNWHQHFNIENGKIKSLTADLEGDTKGKVKTENNLTIAKIETATAITELSANTSIEVSKGEINVKAKNIGGNLLDGSFEVEQAQWPFSKDSAINVILTKIDLEKLLELDQKQGIVVTGKVSGNFPIFYDGQGVLINEGHLHNVGDGIIQVFNNPAVAELKSSSSELNLAFSALENLHYHHLTSAVSMGDDGYMLLVTEIKGRNPDLDNEVNLNLNLSYDLLGLLESLNITEHFESKVIKGLQKKN